MIACVITISQVNVTIKYRKNTPTLAHLGASSPLASDAMSSSSLASRLRPSRRSSLTSRKVSENKLMGRQIN